MSLYRVGKEEWQLDLNSTLLPGRTVRRRAGPKRQTLARGTVILLLLLLVLATALAARTLTYLAPIDSFTSAADDRSIVALARLGTGDTVMWHSAREERELITLLVWVRRTPTPARDLVAEHVPITFLFGDAIGGRAIFASDGRPVLEQRK